MVAGTVAVGTTSRSFTALRPRQCTAAVQAQGRPGREGAGAQALPVPARGEERRSGLGVLTGLPPTWLAVNPPFPAPAHPPPPGNKVLSYFMEVTLSLSQGNRGEAVLFYSPTLSAAAVILTAVPLRSGERQCLLEKYLCLKAGSG